MSCLRIVVAGTGTGVGKTHVASSLLRALRGATRVLGLKPVESGCADGAAPDATELSLASGVPSSPLHALRGPVSPHLAAESERVVVSLSAICDWVAKSERVAAARVSVVETAGGLCSPLVLTGRVVATNLDLVAQLRPALFVLVAADRLGALHDVEVARVAAASAYRLPDAIVLTEALQSSTETAALRNADQLRRWCDELVIPSGDALAALVELVTSRFSSSGPAEG